MTAPLRDCSNNYVLSYHLKGENLQQLRFVGKLLRRYDRYKVGTLWPLFDVVNLQKRGEFVHEVCTRGGATERSTARNEATTFRWLVHALAQVCICNECLDLCREIIDEEKI